MLPPCTAIMHTDWKYMHYLLCKYCMCFFFCKIWNLKVSKHRKPSVIQMQLLWMWDNPDQNMKNEKCCLQFNVYFKRHIALWKANDSRVCSDETWHCLQTCSIMFPFMWSSGQSSWLQIQRSGFNSRRYQIFWEVVGLERGPLSLVSTIELLGRKSSGSSLEKPRLRP
jgi:hypothetical protein